MTRAQKAVIASLAIMVVIVFSTIGVLVADFIQNTQVSDGGNTGSTTSQVSKRILFIGNSYTDINGGMNTHIVGLAPNTISSRITPGGFTLENHWNNADTLKAIRTGKWNVVVLQEQSQTPILDPKRFFEYANKLDTEIRKVGAETVLFMTWTRPDSVQYGVTAANLSERYTALGQQLGVRVAPAGSAFSRALQERPKLDLYVSDGHPTIRGTYLAACVIYGLIFKNNPVGNSYSAGIDDEEKTFLQRIAAQTLGLEGLEIY
jgi:hypothetical protein